MNFKSGEHGSNWITLKANPNQPPLNPSAFAEAKQKVEQSMSKLLLSEQLIILTGLGTSLYLLDSTGTQRIAPTMEDLWNFASTTIPDFIPTLNRVQHETVAPGQWKKDLESLLSRCQMYIQIYGDPATKAFVTATENLIACNCNFLHKLPPNAGLPTHEAFLRKVARRPLRLPRTKLFTTNYDLCFETAAGRLGFTVIDGFSHTNPQRFDGANFSYDLVRREAGQEAPSYVQNVIHLCKLHGSIDWVRTQDGGVERTSPAANPVIIYPKSGKYESSYQQPYLEMMSRFQTAVRSDNCGLLVIGFGFNDAHLVEPIRAAIRSNAGMRLMAVGPGYENTATGLIGEISTLIDRGDRRLTLLSSKFEEMVEFIPDLVADSEYEKHAARFRNNP